MRSLHKYALPLILSLCLFLCPLNCLPTVDPGIFVLQGVPTCREGKGYCVLGRSCTVDQDFVADDQNGHCQGVTQTFTLSSKLAFVCCKYVNDSSELEAEYVTTLSTVTVMDEKFELLDQNPIPIIDINNTTIPEDTSGLIEILGVVTDTTGILDLITRPYQGSTTLNTSSELASAQTTLPEITTTAESFTVDYIAPSTLIPTTTVDANTLDDPTKNEPQDEEESHDNNLEILSLPDEVRKYLAQKQKESSSEKAFLTTWSTKEPTRDYKETDDFTTLNPASNYDPATVETLLEDKKFITDFLIKATTFATNEMTRNEKPSHLKGSPLVPLKSSETTFLSGRDPGSYSTPDDQEMSTEWSPSALTDPLLINGSSNFKSSLLQKTEELIVEKEGTSDGNTVEEVILPHPINLNICGLRRSSLEVSDHVQPASTYDWCWSAALMSKQRGQDKFECSGTLVELDLVITTAACLKRLRTKDLSSYRIVLGDSNLRDGLPYGVQYHDLEEIVTHPDYMTSGRAHVNDIGLIRLRSTATIDHNVCVACISQANAHISSDSCVVSGYMAGNVPKDIRRDIEGFFPVEGVLRESPVIIEKPSKCQSSIQRMVPNPLLATHPEAFLCDVKDMSARSCASSLDGGSPLVCKVRGRWFLTGISSWSGDCTSDPHIYTRVNSFSEWFLNTRLRMNGFILSHLTPVKHRNS